MTEIEDRTLQPTGGTLVGFEDDLKTVATSRSAVDAAPLEHEDALTAEQVAKVVCGISAIGAARNALESVGWRATIAGNRITVNGEVFAQFIPRHTGPVGGVEASWVIYRVAGAPPVWIVGAESSLR